MKEQLGYITNELENAIDYLEQAARFYEDKVNPHRFKWLMIALHGALYGFGVCAIKGTRSYANVIKDIKVNSTKYQKKKAELESIFSEYDYDFNLMTELNLAELLSIWDVLDRCKSKKYITQSENSKILQLNSSQEHAIKQLVEYRNQLAHFKPSVYGITVDYDQDIVLPVVEVIKFIALKSNNVIYYNEESKTRIEKSIHIFNVVI